MADAAAVLRGYNYNGPLGLSWDDTALEPAISIFEESKAAYLILGGTEGPIKVVGEDDLDTVFKQAQLNKAEKVPQTL